MTTSTEPTAKLCRWACSTQYEDIPVAVRKETVTVFYDQVGCMIASATLTSCRPIVNLVRKLASPGECSVIGHPLRTSVINAALANGTIGHGDEVDATGKHGTWHYPATIVPTVLCVAQYVGASGKELARAIALGSEVAARVVSILGHYGTREQFAGSVGSTMGATVSAGLLLRVDADQMEHALGLAASGACGLTSFHLEDLHQIKSLNHGRAAVSGILSAMLAQDGCRGPKEILTVENGFFDAFLGLPSAGHDVVKGLGESYKMQQITYKRYPVGGPNQAPLHTFLQLIETHGINADDIEQIEVSVSRAAFHTVMTNKHPSIHMETILCLAAVYREITFAHIHDASYREDPRVIAFREQARIFIVPRPDAHTRGERWEMDFTVRTRDGRTFREQPSFPAMTEADIQQKFRTLAGLRLARDRVADLESKLMAIETEQNVASVIRGLELAY